MAASRRQLRWMSPVYGSKGGSILVDKEFTNNVQMAFSSGRVRIDRENVFAPISEARLNRAFEAATTRVQVAIQEEARVHKAKHDYEVEKARRIAAGGDDSGTEYDSNASSEPKADMRPAGWQTYRPLYPDGHPIHNRHQTFLINLKNCYKMYAKHQLTAEDINFRYHCPCGNTTNEWRQQHDITDVPECKGDGGRFNKLADLMNHLHQLGGGEKSCYYHLAAYEFMDTLFRNEARR